MNATGLARQVVEASQLLFSDITRQAPGVTCPEVISVSLVLFSAGFATPRATAWKWPDRALASAGENLIAVGTHDHVAPQQRLTSFTDLFLLLPDRRFITTLRK